MKTIIRIKFLTIIPFLISFLNADNIENLKCYPNPFNPLIENLNISYSIRYNCESDITIKIFSLNGELVYEKFYIRGSGIETAGIELGPRNYIIWDGKNKDGRYVSAGGYILQFQTKPIKGETEIKYLKILVIKK